MRDLSVRDSCHRCLVLARPSHAKARARRFGGVCHVAKCVIFCPVWLVGDIDSAQTCSSGHEGTRVLYLRSHTPKKSNQPIDVGKRPGPARTYNSSAEHLYHLFFFSGESACVRSCPRPVAPIPSPPSFLLFTCLVVFNKHQSHQYDVSNKPPLVTVPRRHVITLPPPPTTVLPAWRAWPRLSSAMPLAPSAVIPGPRSSSGSPRLPGGHSSGARVPSPPPTRRRWWRRTSLATAPRRR